MENKTGIENHSDQFKEWLASGTGKECLNDSILNDKNNLRFLENRLWWAFNAGHSFGWGDGKSSATAELRGENEKLSDELNMNKMLLNAWENRYKELEQRLAQATELLKSLDAYGGLGHSTHNKIKEFLTQSNKPA